MITAEVEQAVAAITALADQPAFAHLKEDQLWEQVLTIIATSKGITGFEAAQLARTALKTRDIRYDRWYG